MSRVPVPVSSVRRAERRGANAIEFAMTLPFFLMVVLGMMDYGYLFAMQSSLDNAVALSCREGAMIDWDDDSPITVAEDEFTARSTIVCAGAPCDFDAEDLNGGDFAVPNRTLKCTGSRQMYPLTGFVPYPAAIESVSYYRQEWQRTP